MEFTVNKTDLVRELSLSQGVVEKKTTIPILSNVLLEAAGDTVTLTATDLELGIRCSCPAKVTRPGATTLPARRLLDYVRLLPDSEIHIKVGDNQWASLVCGRSRGRIAGMSRESFPALPEMPELLASIPVSTLNGMIQRTIFAISAEESRFTLNGALLLLSEQAMIMVATDGHRLSLVQDTTAVPGITGTYRALLPRKAMAEVLKLTAEAAPDAVIQFSGDDNHLFFQLGERLLISRRLTGNFPDFERVLPKEHPHRVEIRRDDMRSAIERVSQFSDEKSRAIRLHMAPGEVKIFSSLSDTGESEETLPVEYSGEKVEIGFNAQYLLEFLRAVNESDVAFQFRDGHSAGEMRPANGTSSSYRYVIMPMRI